MEINLEKEDLVTIISWGLCSIREWENIKKRFKNYKGIDSIEEGCNNAISRNKKIMVILNKELAR